MLHRSSLRDGTWVEPRKPLIGTYGQNHRQNCPTTLDLDSEPSLEEW